jgi:ethanolamine utilization protein EutA
MADYLSVGIDIGTSTTQLVFSRFEMENTAAYFAVPRVAIVNKQIVYMSGIYDTPLKDGKTIDAEKIERIVEKEYKRAGISAGMVDTGAVIITGESARKDNAQSALGALAGYAGDFVVATAGPDLEAIIAGKGSGACGYSERYMCTVMNIDIGGGTSNAVVFDNGEVAACGSLDIGGRLVTYADGVIDYVSGAAVLAARRCGISIEAGQRVDEASLRALAEKMAQVLEQFAGLRKKDSLFYELKTPGGSVFDLDTAPDAFFFSGGVADCIYNTGGERERYNDIGVYLAEAIRGSAFTGAAVVRPEQTIRATVVGAGSYTVSVSGSTIQYTEGIFPVKNVPVLKLDGEAEAAVYRGECGALLERARWFMGQNDCRMFAVAVRGCKDPAYTELACAADCFIKLADEILPEQAPLIITIQYDMAKALGQAIRVRMENRRSMICVDGINAGENDFMDFGQPLMDGLVIPVGVKTLIFGG